MNLGAADAKYNPNFGLSKVSHALRKSPHIFEEITWRSATNAGVLENTEPE